MGFITKTSAFITIKNKIQLIWTMQYRKDPWFNPRQQVPTLRGCFSALVSEQKQTKLNRFTVLREYSNKFLFFDVFLENRERPAKHFSASPNRYLVGLTEILIHPNRPQNRCHTQGTAIQLSVPIVLYVGSYDPEPSIVDTDMLHQTSSIKQPHPHPSSTIHQPSPTS